MKNTNCSEFHTDCVILPLKNIIFSILIRRKTICSDNYYCVSSFVYMINKQTRNRKMSFVNGIEQKQTDQKQKNEIRKKQRKHTKSTKSV